MGEGAKAGGSYKFKKLFFPEEKNKRKKKEEKDGRGKKEILACCEHRTFTPYSYKIDNF